MVLRNKFFHYMIPSVIAMWVFSIYTIIDGFFVANYSGVNQLAAVNFASPFVTFLFAVAVLFGVGGQTFIGILLGKGQRQKANEFFSFLTSFVFFFALFFMLLCQCMIPFLLDLLGAEAAFAYDTEQYLRILLCFSPFFILSYTLEVLVKVDGFPRTAIFGVLSACLCNIFLDYIFLAQLHWGVRGAALATGLAQMLSTLIFFLHYLKRRGYLSFVSFSFREMAPYLKQILSIGMGEGIAELNFAAILFLFNHFIARYVGVEMIAPYAVINYITLFVSVTFIGICQGAQPLLSYYYGAGLGKHNRMISVYSLFCILLSSIFCYFITYFFSEELLSLFLDQKELIAISVKPLRIYALIYFVAGYNMFVSGMTCSIKKPKYSILINLDRGLIFLIISLVFTTQFLGGQWIWLSGFLAEILTFAISIPLLFKIFFQPQWLAK